MQPALHDLLAVDHQDSLGRHRLAWVQSTLIPHAILAYRFPRSALCLSELYTASRRVRVSTTSLRAESVVQWNPGPLPRQVALSA